MTHTRLFVLALLVIFGATACGVKGPLDPPPARSIMPQEGQMTDGQE